MKVLAIDTSNRVMGVALCNGGVVQGEIVTNMKKNHSVRLMPAISTLLQEVHVCPRELDRMVVACGPGSYTGVRIGVTVAKTMAWSLDLPLVGVSSLEVLAQNGHYFSGYVAPLFDARRGQVYTGLYQNQKGSFAKIAEDRIVLLSKWLEEIKKIKAPILFLGEDVDLHQKMIQEVLGGQACFAMQGKRNPRPGELAILGSQKDPVPSIHDFTPQYLQLAEAEANWLSERRREHYG